MRAPPQTSAGLTLLETILAITMLAMILVGLHTALSSGVGAYRRCRGASERDTIAHSAIRLIGEDLLRLMAQPPGDAPPTLLAVAEVHEGGSCMLRMRTHARPAPGARAMLVDYFFMPGRSGGGSLVRRSEPLAALADRRIPGAAGPSDDSARYEVVAAGVRSVGLRCFDGRGWSGRWDAAGQSGPPKLVEVTLEFDRPDGGRAVYTHAMPVAVEAPLIRAVAKGGQP